MRKLLLRFTIFIIISSSIVFAGNTGKIAGKVTDAETGTGLPGVNVMILETKQGAITDVNGFYAILNVAPGTYTLRASMIGYANYSISKVEVNIDRTTSINISMKGQAIQGQEVQIIASKPIVPKDVAASTANLSTSQIEALPVQSITQVMGQEAGITIDRTGLMTIRGGGEDQINFMIDGANMKDARTLNSYFKVSLNSVKEVQVQKGGFSAEYGDARSGVINVVTREGEANHYNFGITVQMHSPTSKHFGMSLYDQNSYWNRSFLDPAVCWTGTTSGGWDANTQAQYPSFIGWNAVSNQTMQDANTDNHLSPSALQQLYLWQHRRQGDIKKPDYNIDAGFGGPVPGVGEMLGNLRFFASFVMERSMYIFPLSTDDYQNWNGTLKLNADISPTMKLLVTGLYGRILGTNNNNSGNAGVFYSPTDVGRTLSIFTSGLSYSPSRLYSPEYYAPTAITRNSISAKLTYIFNDKTLGELTLQESGTDYKTGPNEIRDLNSIMKFGNNYWVDEAPFGWYDLQSTSVGDQNYRMGFPQSNSRDTSSTYFYSISGNITSQWNESNQLKTGFEIMYCDYEINSSLISQYLSANNIYRKYTRYPLRGAFYIQDKLEFEQLVINAGVRMDFSDPNGIWYNTTTYDPLLSATYGANFETLAAKVTPKNQLVFSPRLAISHPITENSKLFFNYVHLRQLPSPSNLYQVRKSADQAVTYLSNPDLLLQKTVMYELGYDHNLMDMFLLQLSAYYKDVTNEPLDITFTSADARINYSTTTNNLYEDIRGFELTIRKDRGEWINGFINYTYQLNYSGNFDFTQYYENPAQQRTWISANPNAQRQSTPLATPYARANIEFRTPGDFGPEFGGIKYLSDWRISILPSWSTGSYFTYPSNGVLQNNLEWKDSYNFDVRFSKNFNLGGVNIELLCDIKNLFNIKNFSNIAFYDATDYRLYLESLHLPQDVADKMGPPWNQSSHYGNDKPGDFRDENTPYNANSTDSDTKAYIDNPNLTSLMYLNPRYIMWGLRISFNY
jgi:outer membrane receptor protein involved in Fe transport